MDSLIAKYLNVLNENIDKTGVVTNAVPKPGTEAFGSLKAEDAKKQSENVDIETPEEDKDNSCEECDGEPEKLKTKVESTNPFDDLYNKILKEESFGWAIDEDETGEEENNELGGEEENNEEEPEGLAAVLDHLKSAVTALEKMLDEAEDEGEENEGEEEEEVKQEAVEAETLGHALVDQEKLIGGLTSKNNVVKAGISPAKKKAEVPSTNKGHNGEMKKESESAGKQLSSKNNKVDGVKVGSLFNNK